MEGGGAKSQMSKYNVLIGITANCFNSFVSSFTIVSTKVIAPKFPFPQDARPLWQAAADNTHFI